MWVEKYKDKKLWCKSERIKKKGGKKEKIEKGLINFCFCLIKLKNKNKIK